MRKSLKMPSWVFKWFKNHKILDSAFVLFWAVGGAEAPSTWGRSSLEPISSLEFLINSAVPSVEKNCISNAELKMEKTRKVEKQNKFINIIFRCVYVGQSIHHMFFTLSRVWVKRVKKCVGKQSNCTKVFQIVPKCPMRSQNVPWCPKMFNSVALLSEQTC